MKKIPIYSVLLFAAVATAGAAASAGQMTGKQGDLAQLVADLGSPLLPLRTAAAQDLGKMGERATPAVPALVRALGDDDVLVRSHAAWALGKIKQPGDRIIPALISRLEDDREEWPVRHNSALSLSWIGKPAVPRLQEGLSGSTPWLRAYSADALLRVDGGKFATEIGPVVKALLSDPNVGVRAFAATLAERMGEAAGDTVPELAALLSDPDVTARTHAIKALPKVGPAAVKAIPQILAALHDQEQWIRIGAAHALGELGGAHPETIPALITAFNDKKERVSAYAVQSLAKIGEPAVPALRTALTSNTKSTRIFAAETLAFMGARAGSEARSAAESLVELLSTEREWEVRFRAANALGLLGLSSLPVVNALTKALDDDHEIVRLNARDALGKLGRSLPEKDLAPAKSRSTATMERDRVPPTF